MVCDVVITVENVFSTPDMFKHLNSFKSLNLKFKMVYIKYSEPKKKLQIEILNIHKYTDSRKRKTSDYMYQNFSLVLIDYLS